MPREEPASRAMRIETDPRTEEFVILFQRYGETVLDHIAQISGQTIDPATLNRVNKEIEPVLRGRIEALVKEYMRTAHESATGEDLHPTEIGYRVQFPRRRRHHLRFLTLAFSDLISFAPRTPVLLPDGKIKKSAINGAAIFPKTLLDGIDAWSRGVLGEGEAIRDANLTALRALDRLEIRVEGESEESDRELWRRLHELPDAMELVCPVLMPLLAPFIADFDGARTQMQRAIGFGSNGQVQLDAKKWDLLFARLFGRLMRFAAGDEHPQAFADVEPETRDKIAGVLILYRSWRKDNQLK